MHAVLPETHKSLWPQFLLFVDGQLRKLQTLPRPKSHECYSRTPIPSARIMTTKTNLCGSPEDRGRKLRTSSEGNYGAIETSESKFFELENN
jgi:hypothetical protein